MTRDPRHEQRERRDESRIAASEERYRAIFETARVAVWEEDLSAVADLLDEVRAEDVSALRSYLRARPDRLVEAIGRVRIADVNDFAVELFEAGNRAALLSSLADIFLPETELVFIDGLVALWDGRRRFQSETVLRSLKGRRLDVIFTMALEGDRYERTLVSILDISGRKAAERRLEALNRVAKIVASELDLERIVQTVTDSATELSGAKFGAFFYNVVNERGEGLLLYTLSGAPHEAFGKFGIPRNTAVFEPTFRGTGIVRSDDIRVDPRYGKNAPHYGMRKGHLPVVSYLAVPVVSRSGAVHGGLFFGHDRPAAFTQESEDLVTGIAAHAAIAIDNAHLYQAAQKEIAQRKEMQQRQELLSRELQHRTNNLFHVVQSVVARSFAGKGTVKEAETAVMERLHALGHTHALLIDHAWQGADIAEVVRAEMSPYADRVTIEGPSVTLTARAAQNFTLALHELATNAVKHGALSNLTGHVHISWSLFQPNAHRQFVFRWQERSGPQVAPPTRRGFGSAVLEQAMAEFFVTPPRINFAVGGVCYEVSGSLEGIVGPT